MYGVVNLSRVVLGPMAETYTIMRSTGMFVRGGWQTTATQVPGYGVVSVANAEDLEMIPEMDRVTGAQVFHSFDRIYLTEIDEDFSSGAVKSCGSGSNGGNGSGSTNGTIQRVSDIIIWNNLSWRVMHVYPQPNHGYWKAIAVRLRGN
jgi:hypothetical protein